MAGIEICKLGNLEFSILTRLAVDPWDPLSLTPGVGGHRHTLPHPAFYQDPGDPIHVLTLYSQDFTHRAISLALPVKHFKKH